LKEGDSIRNPVRFAALKTHSSMVGSRCFTDGAALPDPGSGGARASCTTRSRRARWPTGPRRGRPSTQWIAGGPAGPTTADAASRGTRQRRLLMVGRSSRSGFRGLSGRPVSACPPARAPHLVAPRLVRQRPGPTGATRPARARRGSHLTPTQETHSLGPAHPPRLAGGPGEVPSVRDPDASQSGPVGAARVSPPPGPSTPRRLPGPTASRSITRGPPGNIRSGEPQAPATASSAVAATPPGPRATRGRRQPDTPWLGGLAGLTRPGARRPGFAVALNAQAVLPPGLIWARKQSPPPRAPPSRLKAAVLVLRSRPDPLQVPPVRPGSTPL